MTLTERLHTAAAPYLDGTWRYPASARHGRRVAWPWPKGIRGPAVAELPADKVVDCSTLTASLLMRAYPDAPWSFDDYADLQIFDAGRKDSPIEAVERVGVGVRVSEPAPESWHVCQGWRTPHTGHAVLCYDRGTGVLDVLESTSRESLRGPRWRTSTWVRLHSEFPAALYIARLLP